MPERPLHLSFLGAARQVTGSRYLLEAGGLRIMIDCGMFQEREFLDRNWEVPLAGQPPPDVLLLTHAHLDHCGLIPRLVASGFSGPIITTEPTVALAKLIMLDSGRIQTEDAKYKARRHRKEKRRGPHPEAPLYTTVDARRATKLLRGVKYDELVKLNDDVSARFVEAGHILGSAVVEVVVRENASTRRIVFSGDIGQWDRPLVGNPTLLEGADYVVMESTYGDKSHQAHGSADDQLEAVVNDTVKRGGNLLIPTFAIERAQDLIYHFGKLVRADRIPDLPVYLDSPMAVDATAIFQRFRRYLDEETRALFEKGEPPLRFPGLRLVRSSQKSKAINRVPSPKIIMSTSGMCTAGRIKHHLRQSIGRHDSTVLFVGYQAHGTLGREILEGRSPVRIHGRPHEVKARIAHINGFSAHGDREDLLRWLGHFDPKPKRVFLTHGEESVALRLAETVKTELGVEATVPEYRERVELG